MSIEDARIQETNDATLEGSSIAQLRAPGRMAVTTCYGTKLYGWCLITKPRGQIAHHLRIRVITLMAEELTRTCPVLLILSFVIKQGSFCVPVTYIASLIQL